MIEKQVSTNHVATAVAWVTTAGLYGVAAGLMFVGHWKIAILVAEFACGTSAYAAVRHLRCYASYLSRKIDEIALDRDIARLGHLPQQVRRPTP